MACRHRPEAVLASLCDPRAQTAAMRMCPHCERLYVSGEIGPLSQVPKPLARQPLYGKARPRKPVPRRVPVTCPDCGAERTVCREILWKPEFSGRCHPCGAKARWKRYEKKAKRAPAQLHD